MGLADTVSQALGGTPQRRAADQYASLRTMTAMTDAETQADNEGLRKDLASGSIPAAAMEIMRQEGSLPDAGQPTPGGLADVVAKALSGGPAPVSAIPKPSQPSQPAPAASQQAGINPPNLDMKLDPDAIVGAGEAGLTALTGAIAAPIGAAYGLFKGLTGGKYGTKEGVAMNEAAARDVVNSLTYQPRTEAGKQILGGVADLVDKSKLAGLGPTEAIPLSAIAAGPRAVVQTVKTPPLHAVLSGGERAPGGSVGAAAVAPREAALAAAAGATPELKQVIEQAVSKGGKVSQPVLDRHIEADSLPVPIRLTEGQATQDVGVLSNEQNARGRNPALRDRFNEQNTRLIENTNAIRENAAPDVYATSIPEHGEMLIESYLNKDKALNADISAKYKALTDANGGQFPLDSKAFVSSADAALHKELLYDHVPPTIRKTLDRVSEDGMTFENFESLRTNLARIQRSVSADGNEKAAAGVIRDALENLPMPEGAEHLKPLADAARAAAKARFDLLKADPAYKAVVTGKAKADQFIQKYVIGADKKDLAKLGENLAADDTARQVVASSVVNYLKAKAGIIQDTGNFSQAGYNRALEQLRPKLELILNPTERKQIETLGNVARYTQAQPRGSFVNNSNTATSLMAEGAKHAAEGLLAAKGVPVGPIRKYLAGRAERKAIEQTLQTGAGIQLKDVK